MEERRRGRVTANPAQEFDLKPLPFRDRFETMLTTTSKTCLSPVGV